MSSWSPPWRRSWRWPSRCDAQARRRSPLLVVAHAVILWLWHAPGAYAWGLASVPAYWLMQGSLLGSAWLMWRAILVPAAQPGPALVALVATVGQMGLLGALIVFASRPLYAVHFASTWPWGLSPLADQQLAGLLMWVPAIAALSRRGALAGLVEPAAGRAGPVTTLPEIHPSRRDRDLVGRADCPAVSVLAAPGARGGTGPRSAAPDDAFRLCRDGLPRRLHRHRQRHGADFPPGHVSGVVFAEDGARRSHGDAARRRRPRASCACSCRMATLAGSPTSR